MFDTAPKTSSRFGRPAKLVLTAVAAFTLLTGGAALADESTPPGTQDSQAPAGKSLLHPDNPFTDTKTDADDAEKEAAEAAAEAAEAAAEAAEPAEADGAQGVHGACVSAVAQNKDPVVGYRNHGQAVSAAAHACPKGSGDVADKAKGAEKSAAAQAKRAEKSAAAQAKRAAKSAARAAQGKS